MDPVAIWVDYLTRSATATIIVALVFGGMKEWYIWGVTHRRIVADLQAQIVELRKERDRWIDVAIEAGAVARGLSVVLKDQVEGGRK